MAAWRDLFSAVLPRHALAGEDFQDVWREDVDNPKTGRPIGSGPFLLQSFERGRQVTLVRNPCYWGPHRAYLDRLVFRFVPPGDQATHLQAIRNRSVDVIYPQVQEPVEPRPLRAEPDVAILSAPVLRFG